MDIVKYPSPLVLQPKKRNISLGTGNEKYWFPTEYSFFNGKWIDLRVNGG